MPIDKKISQAKAKLLVDYPYFGTIASKLELVLNDDIQASKSDGIKLEYNSDFFQELTLSEMEFVFANGAMHASLSHDMRKNNRSGWLWQLATDYAINDMLVENGMDRPWQSHYSERFCGLYAEEIYAELKDDILRDELEYEAEDVKDVDDSKNENEETQTEQNIKQITKDDFLKEQLFEEFTKATLESESKTGELPLDMDRFFELNFDGKIDWREELKLAIDKFHKDDYILIPPNKKFLYLGIYLPSCVSNRFRLVVAIDSSGSVDDELLNEFLSELNFLMQIIQNYQIELLVCDDKIQSHQTFYSGDILECDIKGQGGTDFRPIFEFIESEFEDTKLLLYFTDLDGKFPKKEPNYDVKWVTSKENDIPFGEIIVLK
ncbi:MAG: VWA-like domain-containing protein [Campylobacterota bacterium]|nr:VWA-like domain-containing protein [Campylobacterota bacterium]